MQQKEIKLLIVDDNTEYLDAMKLYLDRESGISVVGLLDNGSKVLPFLQNNTVDVVLLDLMMPGMDGMGVLRTLQNAQLHHRPNIIVSSIASSTYLIPQLFHLGATAFLAKPIPMSDVVAKIRAFAVTNNTPPDGRPTGDYENLPHETVGAD
jgi:DNA-binding response OmpR family regulator